MSENIDKVSKVKSGSLGMNEEDDEMDESKRKSRNLSEKKRRDQFNMLINELNSVVSMNGRKMDKSTVLKAAMNTLKIYNENVTRSREYEINEEWKPSFLTNEEYTYLMLEYIFLSNYEEKYLFKLMYQATYVTCSLFNYHSLPVDANSLGGFIMVFSSCGKILYASSSLAAVLGYLLDEILNLNIYDLVPENDRSYLENMFFISNVNNLCTQNEMENPLNFKCHFLRKSGKFGDAIYEPVEFLGRIKPQEIQNPPNEQDKILEFDKPLIFVGMIRLLTPQLYNEVALHDHLKTEFISHHNFEWKFLFLDERAPPIIGYSPFEVLGTSGYDYYHVDDLDNIVNHHKTLMAQDEGVSGYYRFLTKGHQWIWLQTASYITRRQWNSKIEFVVCTHRVVNPMNNNKNTEENEVKMLDSNPSYSSNGSTNCSTKTSPPSWQSTTSTTSDSNYCEEENKDDRSSSQQCEEFLPDDNSTTSSSSSRNLYYYKKRKTLKKFHQFHKSYPEYPGNSSDTSSSNSNGFQPAAGSMQMNKNNSNMKFEQNSSVENVPTDASLEDCLQKKCAELQQIIAERQEELRVVSQQLYLARCNSSQQTNMNAIPDLMVMPPYLENIPMEQSGQETVAKHYTYEN